MTAWANPITTVEDFIVDCLKTVFASRVREVTTLPSGFGLATANRFSIVPPSLYVALLQAEAANARTARAHLQFGVIAAARVLNNPRQARTGAAVEIGAYDMIAQAIAGLHDAEVSGIGNLAFAGFEHLFDEAFAAIGLAAYGASFRVANVAFEKPAKEQLAEFLSLHVDYDIAPFTPSQAVPRPPEARDFADDIELRAQPGAQP